MSHQICISYRNLDFLLIIEEFDHQPFEPMRGPSYSSGGEPAVPESIEITSGYLMLDKPETELTLMINNQLKESSILYDYLLSENYNWLEDELLEQLWDEQQEALVNSYYG